MAKRKTLLSIADAVRTPRQRKSPCSDCPFRRDSVAGWLGGATPLEHLDLAQADDPVDCHVLKSADGPWQCAGAAIYRANTCKSFRNGSLELPANKTKVFANPMEFTAHHLKRDMTPGEFAKLAHDHIAARMRRLNKESDA